MIDFIIWYSNIQKIEHTLYIYIEKYFYPLVH